MVLAQPFYSRSTVLGCSWAVCIFTNYSNVSSCSLLRLGSNWVPADNFLTTITPERYRAWLTLLVKGNQNMVRLWGGGVYEPDVFYDICDGELLNVHESGC